MSSTLVNAAALFKNKHAAAAQWGQPLLLDAVAGIMGLVMDLKIDLLGCIRVPWKVKNQP